MDSMYLETPWIYYKKCSVTLQTSHRLAFFTLTISLFSFYDIYIPVIGVYELDLRINFGYGIGHFSCGICICLWFANMFVKKNATNGRQILHQFSIDRVDM